jgi:hypothetical protein
MTVDRVSLIQEVGTYLAAMLAGMVDLRGPQGPDSKIDNPALANEIFSLLTSRAFCYLGRNKAECYRDAVVASLRRRMATGEAFRFFYDIGPGCHATTRPGILPLSYDVGLSELLMLGQVNGLCRRLGELYQPGGRFFLVIDNLCALRTNDIPLDRTEVYANQLRILIKELHMSSRVDLIVESEVFELVDYDRLLADVEGEPLLAEPSPAAVDNVARFLGRPCTVTEAAERMERYRRASLVTGLLLDRLVQGVHMTQRATGATLGFRPFPGGDQRTQAGELVISRGSKGQLRPMLLTSRNVDDYACVRLELSDVLPAPVTYVTFASHRSPHAARPTYAK